MLRSLQNSIIWIIFSILICCSRWISRCAALSVATADSFPEGVTKWLDENTISWKKLQSFPASDGEDRGGDFLPPAQCFVPHHYVDMTESGVILHLLPTPRSRVEVPPPRFNRYLTDRVRKLKQYRKIVHLHEDVWHAKREIVRCRLLAQAGRVRHRTFARKTTVRRIDATSALDFLEEHHLWGGTRAKYYYGLFSGEALEAVATFSGRRRVTRRGEPFASHELLRYCSRRDAVVVGGISKLCTHFAREVRPDDIVTVVDRDWGDASGWHALGFETVHVMDPIVMAVGPSTEEVAVRYHLVGAGIQRNDGTVVSTDRRVGLPWKILESLDSASTKEKSIAILERGHFYPVYDSGVERLLMVMDRSRSLSAVEFWEKSSPKYASAYYSNNAGITSLLKYAASGTDYLEDFKCT